MQQIILEDLFQCDDQPFPGKRTFPVGAIQNLPTTDFYFIVVLYREATRLIKLSNSGLRDMVREALEETPKRSIDLGDFVFENYWHAYAYYQKICKWRRENGA